MCNINHPKFPCKICAKNVQDKAVQCDLWNFGFNLNYLDHRYLKNWWILVLHRILQHNFSFQFHISNKNFLACTNTDSNITQSRDLENYHDSSILLKPSNLELLVNQFNNATPENGNDPEKITSSKYFDIDEMHNNEIPQKINLFPYSI